MAAKLAQGAGDFHTIVWAPPGVPGAGDTADSNGFAVTIAANVTCDALVGTNAGAGGFSVTVAGVVITANVTATVRTVLTVSNAAGTVTAVGAVTGGSGNLTYGIVKSSTGALSLTGSVTGGVGVNAYALTITGAGPVTVTGNCVGGGGSYNNGLQHGTGATVAVVGNATGGSVSSATGVNNSVTGIVTISGSATGGTAGIGASNGAGGSLTVDLAVGNNFGPGGGATAAVGVYGYNTAGAVTRVYKVQYGPFGQSPIGGAVKMLADATNSATFKDSAGGLDIVLGAGGAGGGLLAADKHGGKQ